MHVRKYLFKCNWQINAVAGDFFSKRSFSVKIYPCSRDREKNILCTNVKLVPLSQTQNICKIQRSFKNKTVVLRFKYKIFDAIYNISDTFIFPSSFFSLPVSPPFSLSPCTITIYYHFAYLHAQILK